MSAMSDRVNGWMSLLRLILPIMVTIMLFWISDIRQEIRLSVGGIEELTKVVSKNKEISNENYYLLSNELKGEMSAVKERLVRMEATSNAFRREWADREPTHP